MNKTIIATNKAPGAIGPYSQGIQAGNVIFTSGQLPLNPADGTMVNDDIKKAAAQALENVKAILAEAGADLSNVVKATVFLKDLADFAAVNEVYATYFTENCPARSCIQVAKLPLDAPLEIEVIALKS